MPLTVVRHGGPQELIDSLETAARDLTCRANEEWTLTLEERPRGLSLVAAGPARSPSAGWQAERATEGDEPRRYRRALEPASEWGASALFAVLRDLVWHPLEFAPNPLQRLDGDVARAFERVVLDLLRERPAEPLAVRFGAWDGEEDGPRYVCKVEGVPTIQADQPPAWRWWSPLVRSAAELSGHLQEALRSRDRAPAAGADERQFWGWGGARQAGA